MWTSIQHQVKNLYLSIQWLVRQQHADGSWGDTPQERLRWTSNAVYTLALLQMSPRSFAPLHKAIQFLKTISHEEEEWFLRIPALIIAGERDWLNAHDDIKSVERLFIEDSIKRLPFKVALALNLKSHSVTIPRLNILRESVLSCQQQLHGSLVSFHDSPHESALYMNFLKQLSSDEDYEIIQRVAHWLSARSQLIDGRCCCWDNSFSRTAYVIINYLESGLDVPSLRDKVEQSISFFCPAKSGAIPADTLAAYDSTDSVYTTILYIRMLGQLLTTDSTLYSHAFGETLRICVTDIGRYRQLRTLLVWVGVGLLAVCASLLVVYRFGRNIQEGVIAGVLTAIVLAGLKKLYSLIALNLK